MEFTIATCLLALSCYRISRFSWKSGKYCCHPEALGVKMGEIVELEERVVAMNATEEKTEKLTILNKQVVVAAETTTGNKEGAETGNANATEGTPQAGPWES